MIIKPMTRRWLILCGFLSVLPIGSFAKEVSMAGITTQIADPSKEQLGGFPPILVVWEDMDSVKATSVSAQTAHRSISQQLEERGATLRNEADYPWFKTIERKSMPLMGAAIEAKHTDKPVRILIRGRINHFSSLKSLHLNLEVTDLDSGVRLAEDEVSLTYPPLPPECGKQGATPTENPCLQKYAEFLALSAESNIFKKLNAQLGRENSVDVMNELKRNLKIHLSAEPEKSCR